MMNHLIKFYLSFLIVFQLTCEADILDIDTYRYQSKNDYFRSDMKDDLSQHHQSISSLQKKMKDFQMRFNSVDTAKIYKPNIAPKNIYQSSPETLSPEVFRQEPVPSQSDSQFESTSTSKHNLGFYILPFIALENPGDFEFISGLGPLGIKQEMGFATGWRLGVESPYLFIDGEFSYIRNKFNSLSNGLVSFTGEVENFGFLISSGAKARFFSKASMFIGAGFGAMNQEIGFDLNSMIIGEEEGTLFSYQLFTGIDFIMTEHLRLGLRYRWMRIGEMELFTSRDLHLAELSLGYVF
jgi:opacity protein-like surface antigen